MHPEIRFVLTSKSAEAGFRGSELRRRGGDITGEDEVVPVGLGLLVRGHAAEAEVVFEGLGHQRAPGNGEAHGGLDRGPVDGDDARWVFRGAIPRCG